MVYKKDLRNFTRNTSVVFVLVSFSLSIYLHCLIACYFHRLLPVATGTVRTLSQDIELQGYQIPAGVSLLITSQKISSVRGRYTLGGIHLYELIHRNQIVNYRHRKERLEITPGHG